MLLSCHQSRGEEHALQQGCARCQPWRQHAQPNGCGGARRSLLLCPAPKQSLPEPQSKATHTALPARGKLRPQGRSSGKSAGGSAIPSFHLLGAQLEMLTEGTAKWPVPLPEGMRAPRLLLDGQGVLWRARAQEHLRKLLLPGPPVCTGCVLRIVHQHLRMEDVLSLQAFPFTRWLC